MNQNINYNIPNNNINENNVSKPQNEITKKINLILSSIETAKEKNNDKSLKKTKRR